MPANLGGWTGLILLLVVILLFAAPKLPQLARSLGQSMTIFKKEIKNKDGDAPADASGEASSTKQESTGSSEGSDSSSSK
ncbi:MULTISPECIES: twin-arginine translocase TatA/TatE family subunit [Microcella]|uniref:twin-arginine translocase TatA/TatE family subunit n=1 Tax=Microcella TaxID=337004 RepID=UPI0015CF01DD|nr:MULTISPECIES: twin-arginine translocase TatA/TatE family subunit [Microcella]MBU1251902.1 twin-arginine translocase TatA/TatE family subunit [Actinomycetota bacterium]MBU1609851.1 twin-arginine translocase TatA/TatE family subunit [Actinomycetota bacterium]MBU2315948.1 twin-arginine translocase TatA/TatE family subunit [Actinomycetota bacterium]MBU2385172.1 twin-arginine translocase TatA/TatE family subunit [Actinomycetota bacterium]QOD92656.1 twin-arginine translocase TatA/TatE family subu